MIDETLALKQLCQTHRFPIDAYQFIKFSLEYGNENLSRIRRKSSEPTLRMKSAGPGSSRHLLPIELCEAVRLYALERYGLLALPVLESLEIRSTSDIGDIVWAMIDAGLFRKSSRDRREDFDGVFDFQVAFVDGVSFADLATD